MTEPKRVPEGARHVPEQWPRGMRLPVAAAYIGLSESAFRGGVKSGKLPQPKRLTRRRDIWLKDDLDNFLDRLFDRLGEDQGNEWLKAIKEDEGDPA